MYTIHKHNHLTGTWGEELIRHTDLRSAINEAYRLSQDGVAMYGVSIDGKVLYTA